jgi:hypothetical protein
MRIRSYWFIALTFFLGGATDPIGCFGPGPDPDTDGGNGAFEATISMSLPSGLTVADFKVDGAVVCSGVATCQHKVTSAKTYEVTATVPNGLCPVKSESLDDGETALVELPCGLAPGYPNPQGYTHDQGTATEQFHTAIENEKVIMHGVLVGRNLDNCSVDGNTYFCELIAPTGERETYEGTISDDLCHITYHMEYFEANGNLYSELDGGYTKTGC